MIVMYIYWLVGIIIVTNRIIYASKAVYSEESYQESLHRTPTPDLRITHLRGSEEIMNSME